jgi:signal transduction histidine kinase
MEINLETFDVRAMTDELVGTVEALVRKNNNSLTVRYAPGVGTMHTDLTKTRQILFNLLSNAAKFTTDGSVTIEVGRQSVDGRDLIEIAVLDTGIGLSDEQKDRLFRPFTQADSSIARKYGGTGLGLALVWRYCQMMGGSIRVESTLGQGARFTVHLPATLEHRPADTSSPAAAQPAA